MTKRNPSEMRRGRQGAIDRRVVRKLKYRTSELDVKALRRELVAR